MNRINNFKLAVPFLCGLAAGAAVPTAHATELLSLGPVASIVSEDKLDEMRGGMSLGNDFTASFGITRTISVDGNVVAVQGLVISNLGNLLKGQLPNVEQLGQAMTIVQIGGNNSAPVSGSTAAPSASNGVALAAPAATTPVTVQGSNLGGGGFVPSFASGIQNSLNNINIQARTQIDAQINALGILKGGVAGSLYRDGLFNSQMR